MSTKVRNLFSIAILAIIIMSALIFLTRRNIQDLSLVTISTDKQEYYIKDTAHISIRNRGDHSIDILCPAWCALGNFPTTVEKYINGNTLRDFAPALNLYSGAIFL